ncbi:hypothetical protein BC832DRAFT_537085 [Gaertneriomyces semiglobifer]|nr:hypothetical protein BC832DRAFT_537085 [Gaertneriomyces semiglobifer]
MSALVLLDPLFTATVASQDVALPPVEFYSSEPNPDVPMPAERYATISKFADCMKEAAVRDCDADGLPLRSNIGEYSYCICSPKATAQDAGCRDGTEWRKCQQQCAASGKNVGQWSCWQDDVYSKNATCICVGDDEVVLPVQECQESYYEAKRACEGEITKFGCLSQPTNAKYHASECVKNSAPPTNLIINSANAVARKLWSWTCFFVWRLLCRFSAVGGTLGNALNLMPR